LIFRNEKEKSRRKDEKQHPKASVQQPHGGRKAAPNAARLLAVQTARHVSPVWSPA